MRRAICFVVVLAGLLTGPPGAIAFETDQFTVPKEPLADIGEEVDAELRGIIHEVMHGVNERLARHRAAAAEASTQNARAEHAAAIAQLEARTLIPRLLHDRTSTRLPEPEFEHWLRTHAFTAQPARFSPHYADTVYGASAIFKPLLLGAMAPTIHAYGVYQGTDKIGHLLQQGYDYYGKYLAARANGRGETEARQAAIDWGVEMEETWGGQWWTGVYSNADLAANYAGLKFYVNMTAPVTIDGVTHPAILVLEHGQWRWNGAGDDHLLRPFVTEHFDEAMNPSWYDAVMRGFIRAGVRKRAEAWLKFHHSDHVIEENRAQRVTTWFGEPYGHSGFDELITLLNAMPAGNDATAASGR